MLHVSRNHHGTINLVIFGEFSLFLCWQLITSDRCLAHVINLAMQAWLISAYSGAKYYEPHLPKAHELDVNSTEQDEIGLVWSIVVKVSWGFVVSIIIIYILCRLDHQPSRRSSFVNSSHLGSPSIWFLICLCSGHQHTLCLSGHLIWNWKSMTLYTIYLKMRRIRISAWGFNVWALMPLSGIV